MISDVNTPLVAALLYIETGQHDTPHVQQLKRLRSKECLVPLLEGDFTHCPALASHLHDREDCLYRKKGVRVGASTSALP